MKDENDVKIHLRRISFSSDMKKRPQCKMHGAAIREDFMFEHLCMLQSEIAVNNVAHSLGLQE